MVDREHTVPTKFKSGDVVYYSEMGAGRVMDVIHVKIGLPFYIVTFSMKGNLVSMTIPEEKLTFFTQEELEDQSYKPTITVAKKKGRCKPLKAY